MERGNTGLHGLPSLMPCQLVATISPLVVRRKLSEVVFERDQFAVELLFGRAASVLQSFEFEQALLPLVQPGLESRQILTAPGRVLVHDTE